MSERPKLKNAAVSVAVILGAGLVYGLSGYAKPWGRGKAMEERVEGGLQGFAFGVTLGIVVAIGVLVYDRYKGR